MGERAMILADPAAMHRAVLTAFPDLRAAPVTVHADGWDSVAIEIGGWICKFPRDADGVEALRREAAILASVGPRLTIPVPQMTVIDGPPLFTRHRMLPGGALTSAGHAAMNTEAQTRLAEDVARFLAELHALDADWAALGVLAEDEEDIDIADGLARLPVDFRAAAERTIADHARLGADPLGRGPCYLDAHGRNFAIDGAGGRLAGIYDFGDVAIAGRHEDFVEPAYVSRVFACDVIDAYERLTARPIDRGRVETLIGMQRLTELAGDADHPVHGATVRDQARDWFARPGLNR